MLTTLLITILVAGVLLWAISAIPAIDPTMKQIARVVIIVVVAIILIKLLVPLLSGALP